MRKKVESFPQWLKKENILVFGVVFVFLNILFFLFLPYLSNLVSLSDNYPNVHRYLPDPRVSSEELDLITALNQADAQFYLHIAQEGYPFQPALISNFSEVKKFGIEAYAFFPLYPLVLKMANVFIQNIQMTAFILMWGFLISDFFLFYYLLRFFYDRMLSQKIVWLFFFSPFSIFLRSYYTEGLFLFLMLLFLIFMHKKKYIPGAAILGLLIVTRATGLALVPILLFELSKNRRHIKLFKQISALLLVCFPLALWTIFCYLQTGDALVFITVRQLWLNLSGISSPMIPLFNLYLITHIHQLPWHAIGGFSKMDVSIFIISAILAWKKSPKIHPLLRSSSILLLLFHLVSVAMMSFSRYSLLFLTTYIHIGVWLKNTKLFVLFFTFWVILFCLVSMYFVNFYWVA